MTRAGNSQGEVKLVDRHSDMEAFDRLPPPVRDALNYAPRKVGSEGVLVEIRYYGMRPSDAVKAIMEAR